jgi:hypothetical protein
MGGGKDQKTANKQLTQQGQYQVGQQQSFDTRNTADLNASRGRADDLYASLRGGYQGLADKPGPGGAGGAGAFGGGGGGHVGYGMIADDPRLKDVESSYRKFMETGGWDPTTKAGQQGRIESLTKFGETGGISEEDKARARGGGIYEEFAKTGGFSDKDIGNIRARGTSGIPAMYSRLRDEANRGAAIAGGAGPGRAILAGRMGREQSRSAAEAALNAELGIKEQVNKGRQWGGAGMSSSEMSLQDMITRNKLQGTMGASDIQQKMQESVMGGQQWGTGGINQLAESTMGRQERAAASQAAAASANASEAAGNARWAEEFGLRQKATGLEGLQSLYTSSPDEYMKNKEFALKSATGFGGTTGDLASRLKTGNKSAWDTAGQFAGAIAGGLTGAAGIAGAGGISSIFKPKK